MDQKVIDTLAALCLSKPHIRGLWLHGPRQSGTTTLATQVAHAAFPDLAANAAYTLSGGELVDEYRELWRLDSLVRRAFSDDLLQDFYRQEADLADVWDIPLLFLNDVINVDVEFWSKHILSDLDGRMKRKQEEEQGFTFVAGNTPPSRFPSEWADGIVGLFHVVDMGSLRGAG